MISRKAAEMIIQFEIGSKNYYDRLLQRPSWPKGKSGITIGIGYDLGYTIDKQFIADWSGKLNLNFINALRSVVGLKGEQARAMLKGEILNVKVPYIVAYEVFVKSSLPKYYAMTKAIYPELDSLNEDTRGALVSMIYNRGNKIEGDTRKEMKAIVSLVAKADYEGIAEEIEKSKRLWEGLKLEGLVTRREAEADLIRDSIA